MTTFVWIFLVVLVGLFTGLLLRRGITTTSFTAMSTVWIVLGLLLLIGPETIGEIVVGSVTIKRDVQAAREIRNRVEELAKEIHIASERIQAAQKQIAAQQENITKAGVKINAAEQHVARIAENLREAVEAIVDATYVTLQTRNIFPIPDLAARRIERDLNALANFAKPDKKDREKWLHEMQAVLKQSGVPIK